MKEPFKQTESAQRAQLLIKRDPDWICRHAWSRMEGPGHQTDGCLSFQWGERVCAWNVTVEATVCFCMRPPFLFRGSAAICKAL